MLRLCLAILAAICLLAGGAGCWRREPGFELPPALQHPPGEIVFEQDQEPVACFRVYADGLGTTEQAAAALRRLEDEGFAPHLIELDDNPIIRVAEFLELDQASELEERLKGWGYQAFTTRATLPRDDPGLPMGGKPARAGTSEDSLPAPFCDTRPALPELREEEIREHIRLEEDTQARDPQLWIDELSDPGCVLLTEEEAHALLVANAALRRQLDMRLAAVEQRLREAPLTVYLGSYQCAEDAEADAARAASAGIDLSIQPGPGGSWIAVALPAVSQDEALATEHQLNGADLTNHARLTPTAEDEAAPPALRAQLRKLKRKDRIARLVLRQYAY